MDWIGFGRVSKRPFTLWKNTPGGIDRAPHATPHQNQKEFEIAKLSTRERARLTALAHELDPVVRIGQEGVSDAVLRTIEEAFNRRELLKVKVLEGAPAHAKEAAREIVDRVEGVSLVRVIGRVILLHKPRPAVRGR